MFKGPKAILSSAIANALAEFFEVDADKIQSNLLGDASITLHNVRLKEQVSSIPQNSAGNETTIRVTGIVEEVAFSWAWSVSQQKNKAAAAAAAGASDSWVKDAVLTIKGAKFVAELDHAKKSGATSASSSNEDTFEAFVDPATIDSYSAKAIKKEPGGLTGYVQNQVKMIVDMLTLRIVGFEMCIILPASHPDERDIGGARSSSTRTLKIGGDELELMSLGRQKEEEGIPSILRQKLSINSFFSSIECKDSSESTSLPFLEPFSYSAEATRLGGDRFGSFATGLEVVGVQDDLAHDAFVLHAGTVQIETLMQLGVLLLAPPDKADESSNTLHVDDSVNKTAASTNSGSGNPSQGSTSVSSFTFPLASLSLIILEENRIVASDLSMAYKADGTVCGGIVNRLQFDSSSGGQAEANGIKVNMRPSIQMQIDTIDSIYIPDSFLLSKPIESTKLSYQGETLSLEVDTINAVLFNDAAETDGNVAEASVGSKSTQRPVAPCPMHLSFRNIHLKQSNDGTSMDLSSLNFYAAPEGLARTQVALQFDEFKSHLLQVTMANVCATLPPSPDTFESLNFSGDTIRVTAGHSTDDWQSQFRSKARRMSSTRSSAKASKSTPPSATSPAASMRLPNANISGLKVTIAWESGSGVRLKDTTLGIKPFQGDKSTTAKDLIHYYTKACLSRVPNFVSNAEVLGINVVDSTAVTYGTWLGISSLGAGGGVAAVAGVDAVKGAVAAGKRSRKADESDGWKPGDLFRGIVYSAGEATKEGAIKRGKSDGKGNVIDWAVGAADGTAQYAGDNKSKLGGAAAGGGGFLVGFALAGPIGGVLGGVVANATARKTIESFEEKGDSSEH